MKKENIQVGDIVIPTSDIVVRQVGNIPLYVTKVKNSMGYGSIVVFNHGGKSFETHRDNFDKVTDGIKCETFESRLALAKILTTHKFTKSKKGTLPVEDASFGVFYDEEKSSKCSAAVYKEFKNAGYCIYIQSGAYTYPVQNAMWESVRPTELVKLNDDYNAVISNGGVTVGCQVFTHDQMENFIKVYKEFKENNQ